MNIEKALGIDGWMKPAELEWLALQASTRVNIVEIGSWQGRSAIAMACHTQGKVYCIDTWGGTPNEHEKHFEGKDPDWLYRAFLANTKPFPNIVSVRGDSVAIGLHWAEKPDMIFIDGNHTYEGVRADILAWLPTLAPGGLLCGHDFDTCPGVTRAAREMVGGKKVGAGSIWMATR